MAITTKIRDFFTRFAPVTARLSGAVQVKEHALTEQPPFYDASLTPRSLHDRTDRDSGLDSNVIMAPVMWIMRTFIEAQAVVQRRRTTEDGLKAVWEPVIDHEADLLLEQPNEFYDGDTLWQATLVSFLLGGNAYWRKIRNDIGAVIELWYLPHFLVSPKYPDDGSRYLDYYEYRPVGTGRPVPLAVRDVVHFRFGQDPRNTRLGLSPLKPLLREIFTDDEAQIFSAAILKNMGVPGLVISPKDAATRLSKEDVKEAKDYFNTHVTNTRRGGTAVFGAPTEVSQFGFDPNQLNLASLRDISEERVCAMLGLPAAVVGFGSGMQATKVGATMRELVKMAWVGCLSPMQTSMAKQVTRQLLGDFVSQRRRFRIRFDTSDVSGFQEDENQSAERASRLVAAGILRVDRAQSMLGLEVDETQKVYLRPSSTVAVDEKGKLVVAAPSPSGKGDEDTPPAVLARMGNGNGNGNGAE